jgi:hypothetical protein
MPPLTDQRIKVSSAAEQNACAATMNYWQKSSVDPYGALWQRCERSPLTRSAETNNPMSKTRRQHPLSPQKLGEKGESRFKEICTDASLIANKSAIDAMGWDYLVECPYPDPDPDPESALDKRPHPIECKVQVKTVWDHTDHVTLKLSAAERLAKASLPSFIVVLAVDVHLNFVAMHVFHMLDRHLAHVLKRLRKATAEGSLKINHAELRFNLRDALSVRPDGASLHHSIIAACGSSSADYHEKKQGQLRNLGFGQLRFEGRFTVKAKTESEIAELFLGLRPAELVALSADEVRFGIKLPSYTAVGGIIKIVPRPVAACKIIVKGRDGSQCTIPGSLYLPPQRNQNGTVPFRISTNLFEVYINGPELKIDNRVTEFMTKPVSIKELLETLKFHRVIASGGGQIKVLARNKERMTAEFDTVIDQETLESTDAHIQLVENMAAVFRISDTQSQPVSLSCLVDRWLDVTFLGELIRDERNVTVNPIVIELIEKIELPPISEALWIRRLRFPDFTLTYYAVMDVTLADQPPDIVLSVKSTSLRDVSVIDDGDDAFDNYTAEARLTTGIALSLFIDSD